MTTEQVGMTRRAQLYLSVVAARHLAFGGLAFLAPAVLVLPVTGGADRGTWTLFTLEHAPFWGVSFIATAVLALASVFRRSERLAHLSLFSSIAVTGVWFGGLLTSALDGLLTTSLIAWGALLAKDLVLLRNPLRDPFEPLYRKLAVARP